MFGGWLRGSNRGRELSDFYFNRAALAQEFGDAYSRKRHILLYGLPRQGKRTLVRHCLGDDQSVAIFASADTTFADIFRNYLLTIGCSVTVEEKRRRKLGGKADVKFPLPIGPSIGGSLDVENEVTQRNFSADIASPNDVCYLIREIGRTPVLIIYRFDEMKGKQREALLDLLRITSYGNILQVVLIASSVDLPLDYAERIQMSRYLSIMHLPVLSREESDAFVDAALEVLGCQRSPQVASLLYETFGGSLEQTLDVCALIGSTPALRAAIARPDSGSQLQDAVFGEIRDRTQDYLMALLCAIGDQDWTIKFARRMSHQPASSDEDDDDDGADAEEGAAAPSVHPALSGDPVYGSLEEAIDDAASARPKLAAPLSAIFTQAVRLGKKVLTTEPQPERVRLLAFALSELILDPTADVSDTYEPVYSDESGVLNFARLVCDLLIEADFDKPLILDEHLFGEYFSARGLDVVTRSRKKPMVARFARRIRRLQRDLRIDPPLFKVDEERTQITLWEPEHARIFGDIRPQLKELIERMDDGDGD